MHLFKNKYNALCGTVGNIYCSKFIEDHHIQCTFTKFLYLADIILQIRNDFCAGCFNIPETFKHPVQNTVCNFLYFADYIHFSKPSILYVLSELPPYFPGYGAGSGGHQGNRQFIYADSIKLLAVAPDLPAAVLLLASYSEVADCINEVNITSRLMLVLCCIFVIGGMEAWNLLNQRSIINLAKENTHAAESMVVGGYGTFA